MSNYSTTTSNPNITKASTIDCKKNYYYNYNLSILFITCYYCSDSHIDTKELLAIRNYYYTMLMLHSYLY